jgi:hypothetical protein
MKWNIRDGVGKVWGGPPSEFTLIYQRFSEYIVIRGRVPSNDVVLITLGVGESTVLAYQGQVINLS